MNNKIAINKYPPTMALNANGLVPIKRHMMAEGITKYDPCICYVQVVQETHFDQKTHGD